MKTGNQVVGGPQITGKAENRTIWMTLLKTNR
ncbi:hypothetical protein VD0002_g9630 [Verticillium dahliae]|uniref:Uncharacterized protein n=1 Tax=Verticillium dahliae TaxID=27337 RepID=A0AA45AGW8_VERDA|nr:hypothetical protein BJF96_g10218 [Verticillium dahliae]PNH41753.1 hypothetical protein VD0003_g9921 [Verticillium dahliae]PNH57893.1 hypothetical protein VD0002_g9630 [Verticillium dahliae]